jgi:hypothetical protein
MRFAYADPPYPGQAERRYGHDPQCAEVDYGALIARLMLEFPDGWALSAGSVDIEYAVSRLNANGLYQRDGDYRVGAWVKPFASFKPGVPVAYAWEPVFFRGGRKRDRHAPTVRDWVAANITLRRGLCGVKPPAFSCWLFDLLGMEPEDEFHDMFPGSGAVSRAWETWREGWRWQQGEQMELVLPETLR